ncbi:hypothetical protein QTP86_028816 [Hemibagrus guttatus]|nr:hypothetical protein QTP86_028816 [Hemibagrus guttatus]
MGQRVTFCVAGIHLTSIHRKWCSPAGMKRTWQQLKMKYKKHNSIRCNVAFTQLNVNGGGLAPAPLTTAEDDVGDETTSARERPTESVEEQQEEVPSNSATQMNTVR